MRTPEPFPPVESPIVEFPEGELIPPVTVYPEPLPLDVLANTGPADDVAAWIVLACGLMLVGWMIWATDRIKRGKS